MIFILQHKSPDYSAVYIVFKTDGETGVEGHGLTFTLGRGNELGKKRIHVIVKTYFLKVLTFDVKVIPLFCIVHPYCA